MCDKDLLAAHNALDTSHFKKGTMPLIDLLSDLKLVSKIGAGLHFPLLRLFDVANTKTRQKFGRKRTERFQV